MVTDQASRLSLYRQWRPQTFSEIVGQEAIVQTLRNAVISQEVAHAYLFSGERGIGKTSAARILARAVNCLNPSGGEPCNACANCVAIMGNRSLDIVEIDGASNRGIDHIRQLRDEVNFAPTDLKRKVYIIDEVHMLTNEAFNALLKTLEEPPAHAMFMFATTEPHKVPRTIISRCQAFDFRRIAPGPIARHLATVASSLNVVIVDEALMLIAQRANGGMRDALVMLEQVMSYGGDSITADTVLDMLGLADRTAHEAFVQAIEQGDQLTVMTMIDQLVDRGKDLEIFLSDVVGVLRERLRSATSDTGKTIRISQGLLDIKADLFRSLDRRVRLEIGVLALADSLRSRQPSTGQPQPSHVRQASPLKKTASAQTESQTRPEPADKAQEEAAASSPKQTIPSVHQEMPAAQQDATPDEKRAVPEPVMPAAVRAMPVEFKTKWESMLQEIQQDRIAIAAFLIEGSPSVDGDKLTISFHP